jgi:hypothetical protein
MWKKKKKREENRGRWSRFRIRIRRVRQDYRPEKVLALGGKEREGNELGWPWEISEARTGQDGPGTLGRAPWAFPSRVAGTCKIAYCRVEGAGTGD